MGLAARCIELDTGMRLSKKGPIDKAPNEIVIIGLGAIEKCRLFLEEELKR